MFINRRRQRAYTIRCVKIMSCRYWISERRFIGSARLNVERFFPSKIMPIWRAVGKLRICRTPRVMQVNLSSTSCCTGGEMQSQPTKHIIWTIRAARAVEIEYLTVSYLPMSLRGPRRIHVCPKCLIIAVSVITFPSEIFYSLGSQTTKVWLHWKCFAEW